MEGRARPQRPASSAELFRSHPCVHAFADAAATSIGVTDASGWAAVSTRLPADRPASSRWLLFEVMDTGVWLEDPDTHVPLRQSKPPGRVSKQPHAKECDQWSRLFAERPSSLFSLCRLLSTRVILG
jgi:hypothetical protein